MTSGQRVLVRVRFFNRSLALGAISE